MRYLVKVIIIAVCFFMPLKEIMAQQKIGIDTTFLISDDGYIFNERTMLIDTIGNKYILGLYGGSISFGGTTIYSSLTPAYSQNRALFLAKYDSAENFQWLSKVAECDTFITYCAKLDYLGNVLIGITHRADLEMASDTVHHGGFTDLTFLKMTANGSNFFNNSVITSCYETVTAIAADNQNNIYISGAFNVDINGDNMNCYSDFGSGVFMDTSKTCYISKYSPAGDLQWTKSYLTKYGGIIQQLKFYNNRLYLLGGAGSKINNDFGGVLLNFPLSYLNNGFIVQLDTAGNGQWVRHFGTTSPDFLGTMNAVDISIRNNRVAFTAGFRGNTTQSFHTQGGPTLTAVADNNYYIGCYDTSGNFKWNTVSNSVYRSNIDALAIDSNSNVYAVGKQGLFIVFPPNDTIAGYDFNDALLCSYDSNGVFRYAFNAGGASTDAFNSVVFDNKDRLYVMGATASSPCVMGNDTLNPPQGQSTVFYARIDSIPILSIDSSVAVRDYVLSDNAWSVYPNPVQDRVRIVVPTYLNKDALELNVLNIYGQTIISKAINAGHKVEQELNLKQLSAGMYLIELKGKKYIGRKKLIKE